MAAIGALESGNPDGEDESKKADRLAARAARFNKQLVGNRHKELEEARIGERKAFEQQGLIRAGKTELGEAVDMRGTCERMCCEYEAEFREFTGEVHPLEARDNDRRRIDHLKAVAAYTRSDAGAGHGEAAKLPSDLRTPATLVRTLDYLFSTILPCQPTMPAPSRPTPRTALGYTAGFIRDRTRSIRKEFAMQSSWGHMEAIESFERIARWHILCLRELQEETGMNTDMHIDSAELGRCFTSLRQHYNDRREESGLDMPCANEPEFRAYMLIFDLTQKAVAISTAEVPSVILDHPNVQLAWQIRRAAQRNFDSQKEGSKQNAELGANNITSFVKLLKQPSVPYLLSCLVEVRLREMRRSALRAMQRAYPRLKTEPIRRNEEGQIVERKMVLISTMAALLGCEEQEGEDSAWDDIEEIGTSPEDEAVEIARKFGLEVFEDNGSPVGVIINLGAYFDDNKDAPYTRRWKLISDKRRDISYTDIINAKSGVQSDGYSVRPSESTSMFRPTASIFKPSAPAAPVQPKQMSTQSAFSFVSNKSPSMQPPPVPAVQETRAATAPAWPPAQTTSTTPAFTFGKAAPNVAPAPAPVPPAIEPAPVVAKKTTFSFAPSAAPVVPAPTTPAAAPAPFTFGLSAPSTLTSTPAAAPSTTLTSTTEAVTAAAGSAKEVLAKPSFFSSLAVAGPSKPAQSPIPATPAIPRPASPPSTTPQSASSPSSTLRKSSARSLTRSTNKLTINHDVDQHRLQQRLAIRPLATELIDEIFQSILEGITPDLTRIVKSQIAAREYTARKALRQETINNWSKDLYQKMIDEFIMNVTKDAFKRQSAKRQKARLSARHWKEWTKEHIEIKEETKRDRKEVWEKLADMGLGGVDEGGAALIRGDSIGMEGGERMEERDLDMGLHEAEKLREEFYSPSSFLHTIARQMSPLISSPYHDAYLPQFQILLSTSADSASPPPATASKWLADKLLPRPTGEDDDEDEDDAWWACEGVEYSSEVKSRNNSLDARRLGRLGLCLVEVPMSSALNPERDSNTEDVQDRLAAIIEVSKKSSVAYNAPLILLTWQEETLEEISDRLDLEEYLTRFEHVSVMCLSQVEDLDIRFINAVEEVTSDIARREQLVLRLQDTIGSIMPPWQRLLDSSRILLKSDMSNPALALSVFRTGINSLNEFGTSIQLWLKRNSAEKDTVFDPIVLPSFTTESAEDIPSTILAIEEYLEAELFAGLQDIQLSGSNLYSASTRNQPPPIPSLLSAIATFTFGDLINQRIPLEIYGTYLYIQDRHTDFIQAISTSYEHHIEMTIVGLAGLVKKPAENDMDKEIEVGSPVNARKRPAPEEGDERLISPVSKKEKEGKAKKNSRLLRAIKKVEESMVGLQGEGYREGEIVG